MSVNNNEVNSTDMYQFVFDENLLTETNQMHAEKVKFVKVNFVKVHILIWTINGTVNVTNLSL